MERHHFLSRTLVLLMVTFMPFLSFAQQKATVTGTVISVSDSQPLPGVYVKIKGTSDGTLTDIDGKFTIEVDPTATLVFSFIGYTEQEVSVNNQSTISVSLEEDTKNLEEVVVVGYGTVKKSHAIGAISSVKNDGLDEIPVSRADEALIGKVSGVSIQMTDASAGSAPTIRVRGIGSISADASPLVVVDGVVVENDFLGSIDMNNVASIEILKDAASAAIYGSRGGNGVVMITTKEGKKGKTVFSVNSYVGMKSTKDYDLMPSVSEWSEFVKANNGGELTDRMKYIEQLGTETNWQDIMFDGGLIQNTSISARGGNENTTFSISGAYLSDEGVLLTDSYKKMNLNLKLKTKVNKFLEVGLTINPSYTDKQDFPIGIHDAMRQSPWLPLYLDENSIQYVDGNNYPDVQIGDYAKERQFDNYDFYANGSDVDISTTSNVSPYAKVLEREEYSNKFNLFTNSYVKLKLAKGLSFKSNISASYKNNTDEEWVGSKAHRNGVGAMESSYDTDRYIHLVNENILSYNKTIGDHDFDAVAGLSVETWDIYRTDQNSFAGFQFDYIHTLNAASVNTQSETFKSKESLQSVFGRLNYAFKDKYLLSASLRRDGSSRFGLDTKYGIFPAISAGWRITEEEFMSAIPVISDLKARFSYGVTGAKDGISLYQYMSLLQATTAVLGGSAVTGFNAVNIANPGLGWEQSVEINPGLNLGLFDNRLSVTFDYYQRTSKDLLLEQEIPSVTGFETTTVNIGEVVNSGFEAEISGAILAGGDFNWDMSVNISKNKNELTDFAGASGLITSVDSKRPAEYIAMEGHPISSYYGFVYEKDIPLENLKNPFYPIGASAQDVYVKDLNGDGIIDNDDRAFLGSPYPTLIWSVNNQFNYKQFDFSFMFQGSHGGKVRNLEQQYYENQFSSNQDYITDATDPNFFEDGDMVVQKIFTDLCVQDASYISLRSINLGYTFSKALLQKVGISKARVYVAGQNLLFLTADSYTGVNPEGVTNDDSPLRGGYQVGTAPIYRTVTLGFNLDF